MKRMTLDYYQDSGHGWVKIHLDKLKALGIDKDISYFSYTRGSYAYLEEDGDLSILIKACNDKGIVLKFREHNSDRDSKIRNYQSYYYGNDDLIKEVQLIRNKVREENQILNLWNS
jgi:hypothetical protein